MEVHQHTHTPRKKWNHYLWEFLMLFLVVFAGFLAENWREHIVESKRDIEWNKLKLLTTDKNILRKYCRIILNARGMEGNYIYILMDLKKRATDLIAFLKKEYHLK